MRQQIFRSRLVAYSALKRDKSLTCTFILHLFVCGIKREEFANNSELSAKLEKKVDNFYSHFIMFVVELCGVVLWCNHKFWTIEAFQHISINEHESHRFVGNLPQCLVCECALVSGRLKKRIAFNDLLRSVQLFHGHCWRLRSHRRRRCCCRQRRCCHSCVCVRISVWLTNTKLPLLTLTSI